MTDLERRLATLEAHSREMEDYKRLVKETHDRVVVMQTQLQTVLGGAKFVLGSAIIMGAISGAITAWVKGLSKP